MRNSSQTEAHNAINRAYSNTFHHVITKFQDAFRRAPGGYTAFSAEISENCSTVRNQFNPNRQEMPTFAKTIQAIEWLKDPILMNAICQLAGGSFVPNDNEPCDCDGDAFNSILALISASSDSISECAQAIADGKISRSEVDILSKKLTALTKSANSALAKLSEV